MKNQYLKLFLMLSMMLFYISANSQVKAIYDSEFNKFSIGYKINIYSGQNYVINLYRNDSLVYNIDIDSVKSDNYAVLILSENYEKEKLKYSDNIFIPIPNLKSGIYYLEVCTKQKFLLTK